IDGANAGVYDVVIDDVTFTDSANYYAVYLNGMLTVTPASLIVTANNITINQYDPEPLFTSTYSGFVNGDDASVVLDINYASSPAYTGPSGTYAIVASGIVLSNPENYSVTYLNGTLTVTKNSVLMCHFGTTITITTFWEFVIHILHGDYIGACYEVGRMAEMDEVQEYRFYPNPVSESLTILSNQPLCNDAYLEVFDALGNRVILLNDLGEGADYVQLDMSGLSKGMYVVRIINHDKPTTIQIVKQ
nr:T9SS type A sorting domain-containing protein [Chitinophagales bacterium]MBP8754988.1 T9SS type A sorting domain-containing protein [Chitinophagales bacterium]